MLWLCSPLLLAQRSGVEGDDLKIAFVYNFTKFVSWPAASLADSAGFDICVLGKQDLARKFQSLENQRVHERVIAVKPVAAAADARSCEVLYVEAASLGSASASSTLAAVQNLPVLTISDGAPFILNGGVIELKEHNNKIVFSIDEARADAGQLGISSQLLRLAK